MDANQSVTNLRESIGIDQMSKAWVKEFVLKDIFLQKMPYKIINQRVEHGEEQSESPVEFMVAMKDF